jgi:hypothetical protein
LWDSVIASHNQALLYVKKETTVRKEQSTRMTARRRHQLFSSKKFGQNFKKKLHVDTTIASAILKKGTRGSFHQWTKDTYNRSNSDSKAARPRHFKKKLLVSTNAVCYTSRK